MTTHAVRLALEAIAEGNVCAACGSRLLIATHPDGSGLVLRCGACNVYSPDTRPRYEPGLERRYRQGGREVLTEIEYMQLWRRLTARIKKAHSNGLEPNVRDVALLAEIEEESSMTSNRSLVPHQPQHVMTKEEAGRFIDMSAGLKLTQQQRALAIALMEYTGLNPGLAEIIVYEGKLYITVDGFRKVINKSNQFDGMARPIWFSAAEKEARGYAPDDIVVEVALRRKGRSEPFYGFGKANAAHPYRGNAAEKQNPQQFALNRAFRQAARMGFYDLLSGYAGVVELESEGDETFSGSEEPRDQGEYIDAESREVVDQETGEIMSEQPKDENDAALESLMAQYAHIGFDFNKVRDMLGQHPAFHTSWELLPDARKRAALAGLRTWCEERDAEASGSSTTNEEPKPEAGPQPFPNRPEMF